MYSKHLTTALAMHDYSRPVFIYAAWQNTHSPLEVPDVYLNESMDTEIPGGTTRQNYFGMAACMDQSVGNVTNAHKAHGGAAAWSNTLVVFSAGACRSQLASMLLTHSCTPWQTMAARQVQVATIGRGVEANTPTSRVGLVSPRLYLVD